MDQSIVLATSLLSCALVLLVAAWRVPWPRPLVWLGIALVMAAAVIAAVNAESAVDSVADWQGADTFIVALTGLLALAGGGPVTSLVFGGVKGESDDNNPGPVRRAGDILRGGALIGTLERAAIFASLIGGWPEGLALVLALKGLGRYPELRNQEHQGIAERFIIGTFSSVLWACACAGVATLLR
jgi:hypothetical protein